MPTILLTVVFVLCIMFNPVRVLYRLQRKEIVVVLGHIIIAPFGLVKFRHFFLADVITSAKLMFNDADAMVCFYSSGEFHSIRPVTCTWQYNLNYFWNIVPSWWRFWQCIHRYN